MCYTGTHKLIVNLRINKTDGDFKKLLPLLFVVITFHKDRTNPSDAYKVFNDTQINCIYPDYHFNSPDFECDLTYVVADLA